MITFPSSIIDTPFTSFSLLSKANPKQVFITDPLIPKAQLPHLPFLLSWENWCSKQAQGPEPDLKSGGIDFGLGVFLCTEWLRAWEDGWGGGVDKKQLFFLWVSTFLKWMNLSQKMGLNAEKELYLISKKLSLIPDRPVLVFIANSNLFKRPG